MRVLSFLQKGGVVKRFDIQEHGVVDRVLGRMLLDLLVGISHLLYLHHREVKVLEKSARFAQIQQAELLKELERDLNVMSDTVFQIVFEIFIR